MSKYKIDIVRKSKELPELSEGNFFHSPELFRMLEAIPECSPYMIVATDDKGEVRAHLLAMLWRRGSLVPPYIFSYCRVYGEGVYQDVTEKNKIFPLMLKGVSHALHHKLCLYIEFSDLSSKMFGYREFRQNDFFPVSWVHIHNSLHSLAPEQRLSEHTRDIIARGYEAGIVTREAVDDEEIATFYKMLKNYYRFKFHRFIPSLDFFEKLAKSRNASIFVTIWHDKVIGGSAVVYSRQNAFLWYAASRKKSHPVLRPEVLTIWEDIRSSYDKHMSHINFMNVGLPFRGNRYRDFILRFGGKPVSAYRWFHFTIGWLNKMLSWLYRE